MYITCSTKLPVLMDSYNHTGPVGLGPWEFRSHLKNNNNI